MPAAAQTPLVSVIIPCYDKGRLVLEAAANALAAAYPRLEVIVVNDGSTDPETLAALEELRAAKKVRVIDQKNGGLSAARNAGMDAMQGDFVLFLDHDDLVSRGYLAAAVAHLSAHPETAYVYPDIIFFGERQGLKPASEFDPLRLACDNFIPCSCVHRTEAIKDLRFDPAFPALEDWDFLLGLLERGKTGAPLHGHYLYYRIVAATSMTVRNSARRQRNDLIRRIRAKHGLRLSWRQTAFYYLSMLLGPQLRSHILRQEARALDRLLAAEPTRRQEMESLAIMA